MRIKEGQIFNLMDTNGRRNDVINALQGYLTILDDSERAKNELGLYAGELGAVRVL